MEKIEVAVVGAGIIGLAIASEVSKFKKSLYVLERHESFGQETSSRNSEVLHAGLYYPKGSLKRETCIEGKRLLYEICEKNNIPYRRLGKLVVAASASETAGLERLFCNARANGVRELELISKDKIKSLEPNIKAEAAIHSKSTGIVDSHSLMKYYVIKIKEKKAGISYKTEVKSVKKIGGGYEIRVLDANNTEFKFETEILINCAGLESDRIAEMAGVDIESKGYRLKYCKGQYFKLPPKKSRLIKRLIYPVPRERNAGLGIHATPNLGGIIRLGPDDEYVEREGFDYKVDERARARFRDSVFNFLPFIEENDLTCDTAGIRPKLQGPGEDFRDYVIKEERDIGLPGFINLIGIESPGLTSAPSIARFVSLLVKKNAR
ncbi:MAG: NAD(P)/FAD-dependent oxidoreductase [Candidatus Omnitrophica bacterium]|nr:NAD(P)/FAD-dependent oxidoreductase [Candidatus Omnitrophota bacterium]